MAPLLVNCAAIELISPDSHREMVEFFSQKSHCNSALVVKEN